MTTFRLARSPTASIAGVVRGTSGFAYTIPIPSSLPSWVQIPTQLNESNYYDTNFGVDSGKDEVWIWTGADKNVSFNIVPPATLIRAGHTFHDFTEGDDLWTHYMQYKRVTEQTWKDLHWNWANGWRNSFVNQYVPATIAGGDDIDNPPIGNCNDYDHLYGWGAVVWAMEQNDLAVHNAVLALAAQVETQMYAELVPGTNSASLSGARRYARRLMFYTYVAMMEPIPRWIAARDHMIEAWLQSPGWKDSTNSAILPGHGGHHFMGRSSFGSTGPAPHGSAGGLGVNQYDAGYLVSHAVYYGTANEALWAAYKATGRADVRDMLIEMARYTLHYAWDPDHVNAMTGSYWGVEPDGTPWHAVFDDFTIPPGSPSTAYPTAIINTAQGPPNTLWTDPNTAPTENYEFSSVNILVYGYKLTGEFAFLKRAREHFRQATQYTQVVGHPPKQPSNIVNSFVDTKRCVDNDYFTANKGSLQYASYIFENNGVPELEVSAGWTPPYLVPTASGEVLPIGFNKPGDAMPPGASVFSWHYCTFDYYGGGTLIEDYSIAGAWCVAGSGGHNVPAWNLGACVFDFADGLWKLHLNAHGITARQTDYAAAELTSGGDSTIIGSSPPMPAPGHLYAKMQQLRTSQGGGPLGSFFHLDGDNSNTQGSYGTGTWAFNLATNTWFKPTTNNFPLGQSVPTKYSFYDPVLNRWYIVGNRLHNPAALHYLDGSDMTWKIDSVSPPSDSSVCGVMFLDEARHMIVAYAPTAALLRGVDLDNATAWNTLTVTGTSLITSEFDECAWVFYPPDGCYYHYRGDVATNIILKLTPPPLDPNPFVGTWAMSEVTLLSVLPAVGGAAHHNRLFYVPSLQRLCWIPGAPRNLTSDQVFLIKP